MESSKSIKISFIILMIESILALLYGMVAFVLPEVVTSVSYFTYTGQTWDSLIAEHTEIASYIMILEGAAGGLGFALILANLFVLITAFRKGEKWSWFFVLVVSLIGWGVDLITNMLFKNTFSVVVIGCGMLLLVAAMVVSAKAFLTEKFIS